MSTPLPCPTGRPDAIDPAGLAVGDQIPPLVLAITTTLIVTGAIASRDFFPGHHDAAAARSAGQPDVFMNIMTTAGLLSRFLTDWAGPGAMLLSLNLSLGAANLPGDTMTIAGEVMAIEPEPAAAVVSVTVTGRNGRGRHAAADARLRLLRSHPAGASG